MHIHSYQQNFWNTKEIVKTPKYTNEEDEYLRENCQTMTYEQIAEVLGRTKESIRGRLSRLRLHIPKYTIFTKEEDEYLRENYKTQSKEQIAEVLKKQRRQYKDD